MIESEPAVRTANKCATHTLARMPYFLPSIASVRVRPMIADLAVE